MFIHLHAYSYYSFLEGLASPEELAQAASASGMPALALTDHLGLSGAVEFYQACRETGVMPILGLEIDVDPPPVFKNSANLTGGKGIPPERLALLAMDLAGWANLCRLSSFLLGSKENRALTLERLAENSASLICLTGGKQGLLWKLSAGRQEAAAASYLGQLSGLFPDRLYIELQKHAPEDQRIVLRLASLARRLSKPIVASHSVYYLAPEQAGLQRLVSAVRLNHSIAELPQTQTAPAGSYFKTSEEMARLFSDLPSALEATQEIASRCRVELPLGVHRYPEFDPEPDEAPDQVLRRKAVEGARRLYGDSADSGELKARLDHELDIIGRCGYQPLFLIMEEIVNFTREQGIPISSRGSAASSLVAHCLRITSPDPVRLNLYFERFLNPARATPPDIDTDLCSRRRDEVIRFVYRRYGQDRVAMVGTVNRFRRRSALREVAKVRGLPAAEIKKLVEALPYWRPHHLPDNLKSSPYGDLEEIYHSPIHLEIYQQAAALIGLPRHLSVHAGGVVIAPGPMVDLVPTQLAPKGVTITQFDLDSIEALGLIKIDLLGIRGLTVLGDVAASAAHSLPISHRRDEKAAGGGYLDILDSVPENDPQTSEIIRSARTIGCFQIESPGMRATLKEIQAKSVEDLMIALALYRPGPLTGGLKDAFVRRHRGEEKPSHLHPALAAMLEDTYGVILYQEQVLRIAHDLAGLSLADADLLRRAMSHFDPGKQMQTLKEKFIAGAYQLNQVPEAVSERIWELMAAFSGYGFPKAHAASYAQVAWRAAWCKAHYPAFFMAAVLANWGGYYRQGVYLMEARRMGLALRPPEVNQAQREFSTKILDGKVFVLFMGLDQVRDLTRRTQARILHSRPFHSLADFLARVDPRPVEAENLARTGALAEFGTIPFVLRQLKAGWQARQLPLFSLEPEIAEDFSLAEKVAAQEEILGASVVAHRLELYSSQLTRAGALNTVEAAARNGQTVRVAGMRQTWRRIRSGSQAIYFMALEDLEGMLDVVISAEVYRRHRLVLSGAGPYLVEGSVELDLASAEPFIRADWVERLG